MSMSSAKLKKRQAQLFSTLASVERTDASASKRRRRSRTASLRRSRAATDQARLGGMLLELRILTQRCLTEEGNAAAADAGPAADEANNTVRNNGAGIGNRRLMEEVDALLENLLVARRDLMGHQLDDAEEGGGDHTSDDEKREMNYKKLISHENSSKEDEITSCDDESSTDSDCASSSSSGGGIKNSLANQLQSEFSSLQTHWKSILNKHHSKLALHSGMSVNSSKFQSKAVDISFWEQVEGGVEHERFKQRSVNNVAVEGGDGSRMHFDDSKLYQQMLKDFISSSQSSNGASVQRNESGASVDPAREAAERLRRAARKRSGGEVDLASLLTEAGADSTGALAGQNPAKKATVDRRASKGRKIRYAVHPKLVNFMFPVARPEPTIPEEVWFRSLFGGGGRAAVGKKG